MNMQRPMLSAPSMAITGWRTATFARKVLSFDWHASPRADPLSSKHVAMNARASTLPVWSRAIAARLSAGSTRSFGASASS